MDNWNQIRDAIQAIDARPDSWFEEEGYNRPTPMTIKAAMDYTYSEHRSTPDRVYEIPDGSLLFEWLLVDLRIIRVVVDGNRYGAYHQAEQIETFPDDRETITGMFLFPIRNPSKPSPVHALEDLFPGFILRTITMNEGDRYGYFSFEMPQYAGLFDKDIEVLSKGYVRLSQLSRIFSPDTYLRLEGARKGTNPNTVVFWGLLGERT